MFIGLPVAESIERRVMVLQAFIDDSGVGGKNSPENTFVLSGFVTTVRKWDAFASDSRTCLMDEPKINGAFHMRTWAKVRNVALRDAKLASLCGIIRNHSERSIDSIIDIYDYRQIAAGAVPAEIDSPYFFAFHHLIARFCDDCVTRGITERTKIVFDINLTFGPKAKKWYQIVRDIAPKPHRAVLPVEPSFDDDHDALPLQAADMLAYLRTNRLNRQNMEFRWLEDQLNEIRQIKCPVLTSPRIAHMVDGQCSGHITPGLLRKWQNRF